MWPYDNAEASWLAAGTPSSNDSTPREDQKAAAETATVTAMTNTTRTASATSSLPAPANCNAPAARGGMVGRLFGRLRAWRARQDARETLYGMSDRELRDIGLSRDDILSVTARRTPAMPAAVATRPVSGTAMGAGVMGNALMGLTRGATGWDHAA
ncbi:hypothetical protein C882_3483 [Caenispirillum salinarum AK4]|uniref:YjiS-like domain-containing protein n=1 Tax=Caenispirillum salinarum AK4 TaxID=1238182 RepID=K9HN43_9PROT|nr:DUF1127 domain-containing protein [Caenispirillum salinarum]EKV31733.1 hypothetical protein C882_3483 [Caenispirillum salinarum AK4]